MVCIALSGEFCLEPDARQQGSTKGPSGKPELAQQIKPDVNKVTNLGKTMTKDEELDLKNLPYLTTFTAYIK